MLLVKEKVEQQRKAEEQSKQLKAGAGNTTMVRPANTGQQPAAQPAAGQSKLEPDIEKVKTEVMGDIGGGRQPDIPPQPHTRYAGL